MFRSAASKVMWVGRATVFLVGLAVVLGLLFGLAATALAGTGVGAPFNLGQKNIVNAISRLVGKVDGPMLLVDNNSAGTKATTLTLNTEAGKSPMKVSSNAATATNLSADKFDGQDSTAFQKRVTGACATGQGSIVSINESGTVDCRAPLVLQGGDHTESQPPNGRGCTKEDTWTECGKVQVFVPAGETWTVAIDSGGLLLQVERRNARSLLHLGEEIDGGGRGFELREYANCGHNQQRGRRDRDERMADARRRAFGQDLGYQHACLPR
jgi:hypothetical protein